MPNETSETKELDPKKLSFEELEKLAYYAKRKIRKGQNGSYYNALGEEVGSIKEMEEDEEYSTFYKWTVYKITSSPAISAQIKSKPMKLEQATVELLPMLLKEGYEL